MVRALVGDSTITSVVPTPARLAPAFGFADLGLAALAAGLTPAAGLALGTDAGLAFVFGVGIGFEARDAFPAALGGADFGFADFFDLELAIGLDIELTVWPRRPRKSLATKDGRDRMARREGQIHRGPEAQPAPRRRIQRTISVAAMAGSSPELSTVTSAFL